MNWELSFDVGFGFSMPFYHFVGIFWEKSEKFPEYPISGLWSDRNQFLTSDSDSAYFLPPSMCLLRPIKDSQKLPENARIRGFGVGFSKPGHAILVKCLFLSLMALVS
jgi:hypothetical protein